FVNGSSVTVQELDGKTLAQTGLGFEGKIKNDLGEFTVKVNKLESQYALLKANGYYRNEVTGEKSKSQITLYALTDLSNRDEVNVNLLTHLAYERSLYLATVDTLSVAKAKKKAEAEIFKSFGIEGDFAAAEDLNIFGADDQSAALLAVSILMQSDLSEGDFSERLADYAADIESDGIWNDAKTATEIADWASNRSLTGTLTDIRNNIAGWGLSADVPAFESYVNNFWWQNYGLGICDKKREGEVLKNQNTASVNADVYYICKSNLWQVASDIEKDTATWGVGKFDGEVRAGQVNKNVYYIYETGKKTWQNATTLEKDTYDYMNNKDWTDGVDGDSKVGSVNANNCYVYENKAWRSGNTNDCSLDLRGCTALRQDTVALGSDKEWYICDNEVWRVATVMERNVYEVCSEFGQIVHGKVNAEYTYFCYGNEWKRFYGNETISYGKLVDERDGQIYRTVKIGNQTWMAENLNYADSVSSPNLLRNNWCLDDKDSCAKYGRYYSWNAAVGVCPNGWHIPGFEEWAELYSAMSENHEAMQAKGFEKWEKATDEYGFSVFPAGGCDDIEGGMCFDEELGIARFWAATADISFWGYNWYVDASEAYLDRHDFKWPGFNVRCIKDSE
ncbi:hypothetical protein IKQ19_10835, partial [Candidatus Saccharibacteria bacterium]|nr:hypothetical protein [Candidatus Saccharibacteria bacterium]